MAEPPVLDGPQKTPPFLILNEASPAITAIEKVPPDTNTVEVSVPVRSEDDGDDLICTLFMDFGSRDERLQGLTRLLASTLDEKRNISMNWDVPSTGSMCRQLTLVVTHSSNLDDETFRPVDSSDMALVTWWFQIGETPPSMADCPGPLGSVP